MNAFVLTPMDVSTTLPGRSNVVKDELTRGAYTAMFWIPSCGGVDMNVRLTRDNFRQDTTGELLDLKALILRSRPSENSLSWHY